MTADQSMVTSPTVMPKSFAFWIFCQMSAFSSSALVGMQPRCRHVPPRNGSRSTTPTLSPSCPARMPATYPPGPLPMMTTSYCCSAKGTSVFSTGLLTPGREARHYMQMRIAVTAALLLFAAPLVAHPPVSVVVDSRGNIYYSDLSQVWRIAPDGTKSVAVPNVHTHELFLDAQGNLYGEHLWYEGDATKKWGYYVWRRDAGGRVAKVIPNTEGFRRNYSFVRDRAGNMYFADLEGKTVIKRTAAGKNEVLARGFRDIRWMSVLPDGTLDFTDAGDV